MDIEKLSRQILDHRREVPAEQSMLVGISGIDASGKGFVSNRLAEALALARRRVALINIDGWLNLRDVRFGDRDPGRHFYQHALRLDQAFGKLILPLKQNRTIDVTADLLTETANDYHRFRFEFNDVDIILVEGIFLFKRSYEHLFDLKIWVECSFERALTRAVSRSQEGLTPEETAKAYQTIYFPAQRLHFELDDPRSAADITLRNDEAQGLTY